MPRWTPPPTPMRPPPPARASTDPGRMPHGRPPRVHLSVVDPDDAVYRPPIAAVGPLLLVEDSAEDAEAVRRTLARIGLDLPFVHAADGTEALALIESALESGGALPRGVLLDLNLPGTDGREVLQRLRANPRTAAVPVIVLTTSARAADIAYCRAQHAAGYFLKPVRLADLAALLSRVRDFLLAGTPLPPYPAP